MTDQEGVVNIRSVVEIVGTFGEANQTRPQEQFRPHYVDSDVPESEWRARADDEVNWIATGKEGEALVIRDSGRILYPHRCVIIGTNGRRAFAMHCSDTNTKKQEEPPVTPEDLRAANTLSDRMALCIKYEKQLAAQNTNMAFKMLLMQMESRVFYEWIQKLVAAQQTARYMHAFLSRVMDIGSVDPHLRTVVQAAGKLMSDRMRELSAAAGTSHDVPTTEERPGGAFATVSFATDTHMLMPVTATGSGGGGTGIYTLMTCKVPTRKNKNTPAWKECHAVEARTRNNSAPTVAYNATHCVLVYQPSDRRLPAVADVYNCTHDNVRQWTLEKRIPLAFHSKWFDASRSGMIYADMSADDNIIAIAFANTVMVFDVTGKRYENRIRFIQVRGGRLVTCVRVSHTGRDVALGTNAGEVFVVRDWDHQDEVHVVAAECAHFVEPIWDIHWRPESKMLLMQTIMSVSGHVSSTHVITELPNVRPVAMERNGGLIFVLSKYGVLTVRDTNTGSTWREMDPPTRPDYAQPCPVLQPQYKGCRVVAGGKGLVCVFPDGMVRLIERAE